METPASTDSSHECPAAAPGAKRRSFLAVLVGGLIGLIPFATGIGVLLDPLRRKNGGEFVPVAPLLAIPDDGVPRLFSIKADRDDAWTTTPNQPVGSVYLLRKQGEEKPIAYTARCPHVGCSIGFLKDQKIFRCPCHTSAFHLDGSRIGGDGSVAPRNMDTLEVRLKPAPEGSPADAALVEVEFKRFQTGRHEKIPIS